MLLCILCILVSRWATTFANYWWFTNGSCRGTSKNCSRLQSQIRRFVLHLWSLMTQREKCGEKKGLSTQTESRGSWDCHRACKCDCVLCCCWNPSPVCLLTSGFLRPPATSVNCVSRLEGYRERLVFAEEARLVLISCGVWDPHIDPRGKNRGAFTLQYTAHQWAYSSLLSPLTKKKKESKLPCQELWPPRQYNT